MTIITRSGYKYQKIHIDDIFSELPSLLPDLNIKGTVSHWSAGSYFTVEEEYQN